MTHRQPTPAQAERILTAWTTTPRTVKEIAASEGLHRDVVSALVSESDRARDEQRDALLSRTEDQAFIHGEPPVEDSVDLQPRPYRFTATLEYEVDASSYDEALGKITPLLGRDFTDASVADVVLDEIPAPVPADLAQALQAVRSLRDDIADREDDGWESDTATLDALLDAVARHLG